MAVVDYVVWYQCRTTHNADNIFDVQHKSMPTQKCSVLCIHDSDVNRKYVQFLKQWYTPHSKTLPFKMNSWNSPLVHQASVQSPGVIRWLAICVVNFSTRVCCEMASRRRCRLWVFVKEEARCLGSLQMCFSIWIRVSKFGGSLPSVEVFSISWIMSIGDRF